MELNRLPCHLHLEMWRTLIGLVESFAYVSANHCIWAEVTSYGMFLGKVILLPDARGVGGSRIGNAIN